MIAPKEGRLVRIFLKKDEKGLHYVSMQTGERVVPEEIEGAITYIEPYGPYGTMVFAKEVQNKARAYRPGRGENAYEVVVDPNEASLNRRSGRIRVGIKYSRIGEDKIEKEHEDLPDYESMVEEFWLKQTRS